MIAWHIKMVKLMVNAWIVMDISYLQSKIRHCDVYFECIYSIVETRVYLLEMVKFSSIPSIQNIWNIKKK